MFGKRRAASLLAEFLGTGVITLITLSMIKSQLPIAFFIALGAALAVAVMTFSFGGTSGGHFNPALTFGLWTARRITTLRAIVYIGAQLLGGWAAYFLFKYFIESPFPKTGGHYNMHILVAEIVGTAIFAFGWTAALYQRFVPTAFASVAGLAYMTGIIIASTSSIGLLNPAVALGVRAWVWQTYILGPVLGAIVGVNLYDLLFAAEGESANLASLTARSTSPAVVTKPAVVKAKAKAQAQTRKTAAKRRK